MSSTLLEQARQALENVELYEQAIGDQLSQKPKNTKQKVEQQHHIKNLIDAIQDQSQTAVDVFQDNDASVSEELSTMRGANAFGSFYENLKQIKEYYVRHPGIESIRPLNIENDMKCTAQFSGPEVFGKYLDLQPYHETSCNLKQFGPSEYMDYLNTFSDFSKIPRQSKHQARYAQYVSELGDYLEGFFQRTQPLVDFDEISKEREEEFKEKWEKGALPGWEGAQKVAESSQNGVAAARPVDMRNIHSHKDLEALGLQRLKEGLEALGMKCGGSLSDRAQRLFSVKGVAKDAIPKKLLAQTKKRKREDNAEEEMEKIAKLEHKIAFLCEQMVDVVDNTKRHTEKRQTQLVEERDAEIEEELLGELEDVDEEEEEEEELEEGPLYNPLNLPLGWDGKPIPYWLYKLHGLGVEFKCEICGNQSYWGRKAFDKHFQEWRHAYGMRCLGIPNTKHFHDITNIEDAQALYVKLQETLKKEQFDCTQEEEYEDSEGHVLNRKTYEDLARQGLL